MKPFMALSVLHLGSTNALNNLKEYPGAHLAANNPSNLCLLSAQISWNKLENIDYRQSYNLGSSITCTAWVYYMKKLGT